MRTVTSTTPASNAPGVFTFRPEEEPVADLAGAFRKLASATPKVNQATDAANAVFRATEEILESHGVGLESQIEVLRLDDTTTQSERGMLQSVTRRLNLVYRRISGKYRIGFTVVAETSINPGGPEDWEFLGDETEEILPWDQASREWKLRGVAKLSELVDGVASSAMAISEDASAATAVLAELLADLEAAARPQTRLASSKPKYELAGGRSHIPEELAKLAGKTVAKIDYGIDPEKHPKTRGGEAMTIYFTDGSDLEIRLGSNASNVGIDTKTMRNLFVDMMLFIHETPRTSPTK